MRRANDGGHYTEAQFHEHYGHANGEWQWLRAKQVIQSTDGQSYTVDEWRDIAYEARSGAATEQHNVAAAAPSPVLQPHAPATPAAASQLSAAPQEHVSKTAPPGQPTAAAAAAERTVATTTPTATSSFQTVPPGFPKMHSLVILLLLHTLKHILRAGEEPWMLSTRKR